MIACHSASSSTCPSARSPPWTCATTRPDRCAAVAAANASTRSPTTSTMSGSSVANTVQGTVARPVTCTSTTRSSPVGRQRTTLSTRHPSQQLVDGAAVRWVRRCIPVATSWRRSPAWPSIARNVEVIRPNSARVPVTKQMRRHLRMATIASDARPTTHTTTNTPFHPTAARHTSFADPPRHAPPHSSRLRNARQHHSRPVQHRSLPREPAPVTPGTATVPPSRPAATARTPCASRSPTPRTPWPLAQGRKNPPLVAHCPSTPSFTCAAGPRSKSTGPLHAIGSLAAPPPMPNTQAPPPSRAHRAEPQTGGDSFLA